MSDSETQVVNHRIANCNIQSKIHHLVMNC
jgi:hypothetical protein